MKELKEKKGITLVALIITIIVLLILAIVAISAVTGDGIINYAKNAKSEYQAAQTNENATLESYINVLNSYNNTTPSNLIQFTIEGETYYAEKDNITWEEWISSTYNTCGVYVDSGENCVALSGYNLTPENESGVYIDPVSNEYLISEGSAFVTDKRLPE